MIRKINKCSNNGAGTITIKCSLSTGHLPLNYRRTLGQYDIKCSLSTGLLPLNYGRTLGHYDIYWWGQPKFTHLVNGKASSHMQADRTGFFFFFFCPPLFFMAHSSPACHKLWQRNHFNVRINYTFNFSEHLDNVRPPSPSPIYIG